MGTFQYKALVVLGDRPKVERMFEYVRKFNDRLASEGELTVPVSLAQSVSNGSMTFAVLPTGSKVGWPRHRDAEELMADLEAMARAGSGRQDQWATTARLEWGELDPKLYVDGRSL